PLAGRPHACADQVWTGGHLRRLGLPAREPVHVRAADVDAQDLGPAAQHVGHCHPPISAVSAAASGGPQLPGSYSCTGVADPRMGWTTAHAASARSPLAPKMTTASERGALMLRAASRGGRRTRMASRP